MQRFRLYATIKEYVLKPHVKKLSLLTVILHYPTYVAAILVLFLGGGYQIILQHRQPLLPTASSRSIPPEIIISKINLKTFDKIQLNLRRKPAMRLAAQSKGTAFKQSCSPEDLDAIVSASIKDKLVSNASNMIRQRQSQSLSRLILPIAHADNLSDDTVSLPTEPSDCSSATLTGTVSVAVYSHGPYQWMTHLVMHLKFTNSYYDANCQFQTNSNNLDEDSWVAMQYSTSPDCFGVDDPAEECMLGGSMLPGPPATFDLYNLVDSGATFVNKQMGDSSHCAHCLKRTPNPSPQVSSTPTPTSTSYPTQAPTTPSPSPSMPSQSSPPSSHSTPNLSPAPQPSITPDPIQAQSPSPSSAPLSNSTYSTLAPSSN